MRLGMLALAADGSACVLTFCDGTKTANRRVAATEALVIRDPLTLRAVKLLLNTSQELQGGDYATGIEPPRFVQLFQRAIGFLGLSDLNIRPYSIRRGGATQHFMLNGNMSTTIVRGRWASGKTARIYIGDGLASLAQIRLSSQQSKEFKIYKAILLRHCGPYEPGRGQVL